MGGSKSKFSALTEDILEEYTILTYLSKAEILHIYKIFGQMDQQGVLQNLDFRFPCEIVQEIFTQLKYNPFRDRIFKVFSSHDDGRMSFEDILDLCSAMSEKCPDNVKAAWAFRILDFDEDGYVGAEDLAQVIDRLTQHSEGYVTDPEQKHIIKVLMDEMDIESSGRVSVQEFVHAFLHIIQFIKENLKEETFENIGCWPEIIKEVIPSVIHNKMSLSISRVLAWRTLAPLYNME